MGETTKERHLLDNEGGIDVCFCCGFDKNRSGIVNENQNISITH